MIPELRLSSRPVVAPFLLPDDFPRSRRQDFELGGVAIGDPTQGLQVRPWEFYMVGDAVRVRPYPNGPATTLLSEPGIEQISGTFDQNMQPAVAYVANSVTKLRWFDSAAGQRVTTVFAGARSPALTLDDKRAVLRNSSDMLLFYLSASGELRMRAQRDRFGVEYAISGAPQGTSSIDAVGMARNGRLRFRLVGRYTDPLAPYRPLPAFPPDTPGVDERLVLRFSAEPYAPLPGGFAALRLTYDRLYRPPVSDPL